MLSLTLYFLGPVQPCKRFQRAEGALFVPKDLDFRDTMDLNSSKEACRKSGAILPSLTIRAQECAMKLQVRMKALFQMKSLPKIWFMEQADQGYRHVVCYNRKF